MRAVRRNWPRRVSRPLLLYPGTLVDHKLQLGSDDDTKTEPDDGEGGAMMMQMMMTMMMKKKKKKKKTSYSLGSDVNKLM